MKGFAAVILFLLFALAFAGTEDVDAAPAASVTVHTVQNTDTAPQHSIREGRIISPDGNKGMADMELGDDSALAHRVSASAERLHRFLSTETALFIKTLLRKMAVRTTCLVNCHARVHHSSHPLYRDSACDHYIFGMRRILI